MSLTGNLEDLGLGDILQIISLSRKSGTLRISAMRGEARIVFRDGQVRGALAPGSPVDFCALLTTSGAVAKDDFKYAEEESAASGQRVSAVLLTKNLISEERLETLRREVAENAVIEIFDWRSGEFCFDIGESEDPAIEMFASGGINAQYLAMEASRRRDESSLSTPEGVDDPMGFAELGDELRAAAKPMPEAAAVQIERAVSAETAAETADGAFGVDAARAEPTHNGDMFDAEECTDVAPLAEVEPLLSQELASEWPDSSTEIAPPPDSDSAVAHAEENDPNEDTARSHFEGVYFGNFASATASAPESVPAPVGQVTQSSEELRPVVAALEPPALPTPRVADAMAAPSVAQAAAPLEISSRAEVREQSALETLPPVILVDSHLPVLEWIKKALMSSFEHVHIFQRTNLAVGRVRQYLARGQVPIFLIAPDAPPDTLTGAKNSEDLVQRLRKQAPRMMMLTLCEGPSGKPLPETQGVIEVPSVNHLLDFRRAAENEALQATLHQNVLYHLRRFATQNRVRRAPAAVAAASQQQALHRLREASACLREASVRGDVLESMMRFVGERFSRVALFLVRDGMAVGLSQIGLERAEGPTGAALAQVSIPVREPAWFKSVLDMRAPICCAPSNDGDRKLAGLLGRIVPDEAYVAPIESGDQIIALLYADNLPERAPIGDTSALEVLLHQAGLALDRSFFERLNQEKAD